MSTTKHVKRERGANLRAARDCADRSRRCRTEPQNVDTSPDTALGRLQATVVGCVDTHLHVGPDPWIARLVADYAFVLQSLLAEATGNNAETRRDLDLWLGRLTQRCDSDAIKCIPWFTGPGCALVRLLVEHNWSSGNIMRRPCDMFPIFGASGSTPKSTLKRIGTVSWSRRPSSCTTAPTSPPISIRDWATSCVRLHATTGFTSTGRNRAKIW